ncbi:hypothetical protein OQA88_11399 [Cercophora sp. LCS_1]
MHLPLPLLALASTAFAHSLTLRIPPTPQIPNPSTLPPSTHATLTSLHEYHSAPLSVSNTFVFPNLTAGSYLADIHCATYGFAPLRVDILPEGTKVWETYRGNDWENTGELLTRSDEEVVDVKVLGGKGYFMERSKFNAFSILKNPMIILGLVSMGIFIGMPYLVDNMDPEMRAEWEERQKSNPMNGIMGAATGQPGAAGGFDMAAFLAGSGKKEEGSGGNGEQAKRRKR